MQVEISITYGIFEPLLEEQLKEFNIPKEKTQEWESIKKFIYGSHIAGVITDKQQSNLFSYLTKTIARYIGEMK